MGTIATFITLRKAIAQKCYCVIPACISFFIYEVFCVLRTVFIGRLGNYQNIISIAEIIVLFVFVGFVFYASTKKQLSERPLKLPMFFALGAGLCRIACMIYLRWMNHYIRQFLDNVEMFMLVSQNSMVTTHILFAIVWAMGLAAVICFLVTLFKRDIISQIKEVIYR